LIGKKIGKEKEAKILIAKLENDKKQLDKIIKNQKNQKKVMFILNHGGSSPMVAGLDTAANSIIEISGAKNVVTDYKSYKPLTPEAALILAPDIILISDEGLKQFGGKDKLLNNAALKLTPAAKNQRVIVMDSMLMLGSGPRIIEAAKILNSQY
jgi:iron complex transport system substrate-binding protein